MKQKILTYTTMVTALAATAAAAELTLQLAGNDPIVQQTRTYQCDSHAAAIGLPAGNFKVQYVNGAGNSLALLPINGKSLIFSNVISGSGARYAARQYIWWEAGARGVTLYSDSLGGKNQTTCQEVKQK
ncbi:MAG TPA: MliC family protein [Bryobacteraceae bacterium]|jgi:membrane-bound inhibitor of C-type lysozyme